MRKVALLILSFIFCGSSFGATFVPVSGTLHASASASGTTGTIVDNPADQTLGTAYGSFSDAAKASNPSGFFGTSVGALTTSASLSSDAITLQGNGQSTGGGGTHNSDFSGDGNGSISLVVDIPSNAALFVAAGCDSMHANGQVTIKNGLGTSVYTNIILPNNDYPFQLTNSPLNLAAGEYTIQAYFSIEPSAGTSGGGIAGMTLTLAPEPVGTLAIIGLIMPMIRFRRSSRH
ncbi:MAG TPA: hypothetical protein VHS31_14255 [Tepidisphaeraceae bacterium]|jgi:hypothetical protein|nr:hypothetical protein [Tepidisphaeraceae bacterium]